MKTPSAALPLLELLQYAALAACFFAAVWFLFLRGAAAPGDWGDDDED